MKIPRNSLSSVLLAVIETGALRATKFLSAEQTVTAKRVAYGGKIDKRSTRGTVVVSFGRPNYAEREFIRKCKRAGEPFPVRKLQLKFAARGC